MAKSGVPTGARIRGVRTPHICKRFAGQPEEEETV